MRNGVVECRTGVAPLSPHSHNCPFPRQIRVKKPQKWRFIAPFLVRFELFCTQKTCFFVYTKMTKSFIVNKFLEFVPTILVSFSPSRPFFPLPGPIRLPLRGARAGRLRQPR